jgi:hypothetical protein
MADVEPWRSHASGVRRMEMEIGHATTCYAVEHGHGSCVFFLTGGWRSTEVPALSQNIMEWYFQIMVILSVLFHGRVNFQ